MNLPVGKERPGRKAEFIAPCEPIFRRVLSLILLEPYGLLLRDIYIYIYRERERERESKGLLF
jgi:hypothetical protein